MSLLDLRGDRRAFLKFACFSAFSRIGLCASRPPNIVLIYADDLGYGDLNCYGSRIPTPNINRLASEGMRFTNFYSASSVCSPARAALLTGRYPARVGVPFVIAPEDTYGLIQGEATIANSLRDAGYATACIGKWHVGHMREYLPKQRGFDEYFGIPYSNDMNPSLIDNNDVVEKTVKLNTLTARYTQRALDFINRNVDRPFFLYLAHTAPHIPLTPSAEFVGKSGQGAYGDVVNELDANVGQVLDALKEKGLEENTLVIFTSDNGPWYQGSPGQLRGRKGDSYDGGLRVPFIARMPNRIPSGAVSDGMATQMDLFPTLAKLGNGWLPSKVMDGVDIWPMLTGEKTEVEREVFLYFNGQYLQCARMGPWKLHLARYNVPMYYPTPPTGRVNLPLPRPELYNVLEDPSEGYDRSDRQPEIVVEIRKRVERVLATGFPDYVTSAWVETMGKRVEDTPADAPPVESNP